MAAIIKKSDTSIELFIIGWDYDNMEIENETYVGVTDDESGLSFFIGEYESKGLTCDGFIRIYTREEMKEVIELMKDGETVDSMNDENAYAYIPNFKGELLLEVVDNESGISYIDHYDNTGNDRYIGDWRVKSANWQLIDEEEEPDYDEFLRFPEGTKIEYVTLSQLLQKGK